MRQAIVRSLLVTIVLTCFLLSPMSGALATAPVGTRSCDGSWQVLPVPHARHGGLYGVSATSPDDVWALGVKGRSGFVEHWDGRAWSLVPTPQLPRRSALWMVSAVAGDDVWAAGGLGHLFQKPLVAHWDGTSWTRVALPDFHGSYVAFEGIAADRDRTWLVGFRQPRHSFRFHPLIVGWDGHTWSVSPVRLSRNGQFNELTDVAIGADGRAWASGDHDNRPLLLRWNGTRWQEEGVPFPLTGLDTIDVAGASNVLALGRSVRESGTRFFSLLGTRRVVSASRMPFARSYDGGMEGVAWDSDTTAWAVGWNQTHRDPSSGGGVIERWTGRRWKVVSDPAGGGDALLDIASADGVTFAVGLATDGSSTIPLAERYC